MSQPQWENYKELSPAEKKEFLTANPDLKKEFLERLRTEEKERRGSETSKKSSLQMTLQQATVKQNTLTPEEIEVEQKIAHLMDTISEKTSCYREKMLECFEIGRYWNWVKSELNYTSNALEQQLVDTKDEDNRRLIRKVYHQEIKNHDDAFDFILESALTKSPVTISLIQDLHKKILHKTEDEHAGIFRQCKVRFDSTQTILPAYQKVPYMTLQLAESLNNPKENPLDAALRAHFELVAIHPFTDGNGRTSRLLMNMILLKNDYPPLWIEPSKKACYINALETYNTKGDSRPYKLFMLSCLDASLDKSIGRLKHSPRDVTRKEVYNDIYKQKLTKTR